jgi:endonuclease-3
MRLMSKREIREFYRRLAETRPIPQTELEFINPFTLLIAVVLSAQATDVGVNKATAALFALADTPEKMLALGEERLIELIRTIGLYRTKAKNVIALSRILVEQYGGEAPRDRAALEALPGVGRKTASVVLNVAFGEPTIAVDTHIFRVGNRTGLAPGKTPLQVEMALEQRTPREYKAYAHHWLILHGRYVCKARKPDCPVCVVADLCHYPAKIGPAELIAARAAAAEPKALTEPEALTEPKALTEPRAAVRRGAAPAQAPAKTGVSSRRGRASRPA